MVNEQQQADRLIEYYKHLPEVFATAEVLTNILRSALSYSEEAVEAATTHVRVIGVPASSVEDVVSRMVHIIFAHRGVDVNMGALISGLYIWYAGEFTAFANIYILAHARLVSDGLVFKFRVVPTSEDIHTPRTMCYKELQEIVNSLRSQGIPSSLLASLTGIPYQTLYSWVSGRRVPSLGRMGAVMTALRSIRDSYAGKAAEDGFELEKRTKRTRGLKCQKQKSKKK